MAVVSSPVEPSAPQIAWRAIEQMRRHPVARNAAELAALLESSIREPVSDKAALVQRAAELIELREKGLFRVPDGESSPGEMQKAQTAAPVVLTVVTQVPPNAKEPVATPKKAKPAKPTAKKVLAPVKTSLVSVKKMAAPTAAQVAERVLVSLKKMPDNKPTRRAGLLKHIATHAAKAVDPKALVQCFTLSGTYNESPRGQLRGAWPQAWWVHVKATQQSRWPLGGSPCGKPEKGSRRRCSSCQGRRHWLRTAPCRKPFSGFYKCLIA